MDFHLFLTLEWLLVFHHSLSKRGYSSTIKINCQTFYNTFSKLYHKDMEINYKDIVVQSPRQKQTIYSYLKMNGYSENFLKNLRKVFGYIKLNGVASNSDVYIKQGDIISINVNPNTKTSIYPCIIPLDIVYEDNDVVAVNKPSMLATMPSKSHFSYNLSGALVARYESQPNFVVRIINRLDKEACGIVLVAKNSLASNFLNQPNNVTKTYYALCDGILTHDYVIDKNIETLINKDGYNINKRVVSTKTGKPATTYVNVVKTFDDYTLVKITLEHGRTHQIRVHMSSIGHPLLGDTLYGGSTELISHTALCCKELSFISPSSLQPIFLNIPFPADFIKLLGNEV